MFAEIGNLLLYICFLLSLLTFSCEIIKQRFIVLTVFNVITFLCSLLAFLSLIGCYVVSDFSVLNVVNNSHILKPLLYKISAAWGNHEGSMLLWITTLNFFSVLFGLFAKGNIENIKLTIAIQSLLSAFFTGFTILTSNPFVRIFPSPLNGFGFNPILQDVGLAMHPPVLYLGYVGFSVTYSAAIAALITRRVDKSFAIMIRPWVLLSWAFLTLGIGFGSWWAYRELGWGGFWFWDPVENSSLMPWFTGTALLHSLIVLERFERMVNWNLLLGITTFMLSMVGTFLVRSNLITSIHSFASDPLRGMFILLFIAITSIVSLTLFAFRGHTIGSLKQKKNISLLSVCAFIEINNILLSLIAFTVIFGTLYPMFLDILTGAKIAVGAPYFNNVIGLFSIIGAFILSIGSQLSSKDEDFHKLVKANVLPGIIALLITLLIFYNTKEVKMVYKLGSLFSLFGIISLLVKTIREGFAYFSKHAAMIIGHLGIFILFFSIFVYASFERESEASILLGESIELNNFKLKLEKIDVYKGEDYLGRVAEFTLSKNGFEIGKLFPETRFYPVETQQTIESAIYHHLFYDLYIATGELAESGYLTVRVYHRPMISWIWFSCLLIFLGGVISFVKQYKKYSMLKLHR